MSFISHLAQQAVQYVPSAVMPAGAKGALRVAAFIGCAEIISRIRSYQSYENTEQKDGTSTPAPYFSPFRNVDAWVGYPAIAITAALAYKAFEAHSWNGKLAAMLFFAPLAYRTFERTFQVKFKATEAAYTAIRATCRATLAGLSIYMTWSDLTSGVPGRKLACSILTTIALIESLVQNYS